MAEKSVINIRMSEKEIIELEEFAKAHGLNKTSAIKYCINTVKDTLDIHRKLNVIMDKLEKLENQLGDKLDK